MAASNPTSGRGDDGPAGTDRMFADARVTHERLRAARPRPAPSLRHENLARDRAKRDLEVSESAARLAAALHLHLDPDLD